MENKKPDESQELSFQEMINISGGIAVGEYYPDEYPTDNLYNDVSEAIAKKIEDIKLPDLNHKTPDINQYF